MVLEISSLQQLMSLINSPKVTVVDFNATWCGPCKMVAPQYEQMSRYYDTAKVSFCKVDVDRNQDCAQRYNVTAMPTFIVFRNGAMVESIRGANMQRLQQVIDIAVAQVPAAAFTGAGRTLGGDTHAGQSSLLSSAAAAAVADPLGNAMCRLSQALTEQNAIAKKDALDALYQIVVVQEKPLGVALVPYLCSTKAFQAACLQSLFDYIDTMAAEERSVGRTMVFSLAHFFVQAFSHGTFDSRNDGVLHRALANFVRCPAVRALLPQSSRFLSPTAKDGETWARETLLGSLLEIGSKPARSGGALSVATLRRQQHIMNLLTLFPEDTAAPGKLNQAQADRTIDDLQAKVEAFSMLAFPIFRELLGDKDTTRLPTLTWIGRTLTLNADYAKTMMDNSRVASATAMVQLLSVLTELALPVTTGSNVDPTTIPVHYLYDPAALVSFGTDVERIAHFGSDGGPALPTLPDDESARAYAPRVHLFFAAIRCVGLTSSAMLLRYDTYARNVRYPHMQPRELHYFYAEMAHTKALLGGRALATKTIRCLNGVARWLLKVLGAQSDGTLPSEVPLAWKTLPQCIVDDVIRGTKLMTTLNVPINPSEIHDIMSLSLVLMGNSTYFPKPHTHALFPPLLTALLQNRESSEALQRHPWFHGHIIRGCILCYIAMEKSEYEKVQTRYELSHCLRAFLRNASLCAPVRAELEDGATGVLERFSHMVTADVNSAVDSIVQTLQKMNAMVAAGVDIDAPPRRAGSPRQQQPQPQQQQQQQRSNNAANENEESDGEGENGRGQTERSYNEHGDELRSSIMLFDVSVDVFIEMTVQFPKGVAQNLVAQQISQMLARSITTFAGPKCRDLVIKNADRYGFYPKMILTKLVECLVQFETSTTFLRHICESGISLKDIYESIGAVVHRQLVREDLRERLTAMYNRMLSTQKQVEQDAALWDEAPDFALDVLLSTPLIDPVAIPTEVKEMDDLVFTNRATLHHALLTEPKNPYTNEYLDEGMVNEFNSRKDVSAAVQALKKRIADWLESARMKQDGA